MRRRKYGPLVELNKIVVLNVLCEICRDYYVAVEEQHIYLEVCSWSAVQLVQDSNKKLKWENVSLSTQQHMYLQFYNSLINQQFSLNGT